MLKSVAESPVFLNQKTADINQQVFPHFTRFCSYEAEFQGDDQTVSRGRGWMQELLSGPVRLSSIPTLTVLSRRQMPCWQNNKSL